MGKTFVEKILGKKVGKEVVPGEFITISPDWVMSHDNTAAISKTFKSIGVTRVKDPGKIVIILDHCVPAADEKYAQNHKEIREFVSQQGILNFYDVGWGVCHQVFVEEGFARPGEIILGSDSHTTSYGALGAFSTGIGRTEMAAIYATDSLWLLVPESFKIELKGRFPSGVTAKDLALYIIGQIGADGALYKSVEFCGELTDSLSISERLVFTNLVAEMGAKNGYFPPDNKVERYLNSLGIRDYEKVLPDKDASYEKTLEFDASSLEPQIALPHTVDNVKSISQIKKVEIDQVLLGTCTNGRLDDLEGAANILKGKKIASRVRLLVFPASRKIYLEALKKGYLEIFSKAGGIIMNPGCGPCLGAHEGVLAPGEICLSTANRNFKGRMGCRDAEVYLCSPLVAAASALRGKISDPREV